MFSTTLYSRHVRISRAHFMLLFIRQWLLLQFRQLLV